MATAIIVPCRNEAGEIENLLKSILANLNPMDEIVAVEGGSYDSTWDVVRDFASKHKEVIAIQQKGKGKFDAVLEGIKSTQKDVVMIWDADGTVSFSDNLRIYSFESGSNYLITGDRLQGQREPGAMQRANFIGNWVFAILWGLILRQKPLDALCGTKKFQRELISRMPQWLKDSDPYGDFALLGTALFECIPVITTPVDYSARRYGQTNIRRWSGGFLLFRVISKIALKRKKYAKR